MAGAAINKHQQNSARTREKLIEAAERLYGERSIDAVSMREITAAAGQKNPNALQYHLGDREGLLQAIVGRHSARISMIRDEYCVRAEDGEWPASEAAARCLVMPIVEYIDTNPAGINFVRIVSQITALYQNAPEKKQETGIVFPEMPGLRKQLNLALASMPDSEAQRRVYLGVITAFHSLADIYSAGEWSARARKKMVDQLICLLESFFAAPATGKRN